MKGLPKVVPELGKTRLKESLEFDDDDDEDEGDPLPLFDVTLGEGVTGLLLNELLG